MLKVITAAQARSLLLERIKVSERSETVSLDAAVGRTLFSDVVSGEFLPDFHRSMVDGYAVRAADTFGCSDVIPAVLCLAGEVSMGVPAGFELGAGECAYVPTGGQLPSGADAMVMLEYAEDFGGGTIAIQKPAAPGTSVIFRGDDVSAGNRVLHRGRCLLSKDIGALAALGCDSVPVFQYPKVAILSTGDELVPEETQTLAMGQIRDVNGPMLSAAVAQSGAETCCRRILPDDPELLRRTILETVRDADIVLLSGGSSVGAKDVAETVLSELGEVLFHGLALKPGKPTLAAIVGEKPVLGLPGHPVAAYFVYTLLVKPLLYAMMDSLPTERCVCARCACAIPSNHGREECVPVRLEVDMAVPIIGKSGLITTLSSADGYIRIPRDAEGVAQGESVSVFLF